MTAGNEPVFAGSVKEVKLESLVENPWSKIKNEQETE